METKKLQDLKLNEIRSDEFKTQQINAYQNDLARLHKRLEEFILMPCPACGEQEAIKRFEKYKCTFVECVSCSTLYMSPRPTPAVMDDYYSNSENYDIWNKYIFPKSEAARREKICQPNLNRIIEECKSMGMVKPTLLEIGPGFGTFSALANESGFFGLVSVVERTPSMADSCRSKGLDVIESALEEIIEEKHRVVDVAVCFEVIEHVFEPVEFLMVVNKLMKPGGVLIFTCPNGKGFDTLMLKEASPSVDTEHVNLFNPESILVLLDRAGFDALSVETPGSLDVELVKRAQINKEVDFSNDPFWHSLLLDKYESIGEGFQKYLVENNMAGSMRIIARKKS